MCGAVFAANVVEDRPPTTTMGAGMRAVAVVIPVRHFELPSSPIAVAALTAANDGSKTSVFNHSVRTYWHARSLAEHEGILEHLSVDLLFAATMLRDIGARSKAPGRERFEIEGADIAAAVLLGIGVREAHVQQVWDAIALHMSAGLADRRGALPRIVRAGVLADFVRAPEERRIPQAELHDSWPRLDVEVALVDGIIARATNEAALPHYGMGGVLVAERAATGTTELERATRSLAW
jgi:hypothetical protein